MLQLRCRQAQFIIISSSAPGCRTHTPYWPAPNITQTALALAGHSYLSGVRMDAVSQAAVWQRIISSNILEIILCRLLYSICRKRKSPPSFTKKGKEGGPLLSHPFLDSGTIGSVINFAIPGKVPYIPYLPKSVRRVFLIPDTPFRFAAKKTVARLFVFFLRLATRNGACGCTLSAFAHFISNRLRFCTSRKILMR